MTVPTSSENRFQKNSNRTRRKMKKSKACNILAASFCLFSLLGVALGDDNDVLHVEGQVYCDTCNIGFVTQVSEFMAGTFTFVIFS